ncbi:SDR family NAD(P)-dependent oxidoreductase, partial [Streptomyces sp. NPDC046215]
MWEPHGTVLITGGTGQLGGHVARWAARRGARHIMLVSRRGAQGEGVTQLVEELAGLGVGVTVAACDVGDREALGELLAGVPEEFPLCGVVHAAGVLDDGVLGSLSPGRLAGVRRAKAVGAWNLHELTRCADLSAFVVFSSAAGSWGAPGQGNYAAANAEVDALVRYRRHLGLPGLSVAWGAWAGEGMAGDAEVAGQLRRRGMAAMDPQLALEALGQALDHDDTCVTVTDIDWKRFLDHAGHAGVGSVLGDIPEVRALLDGETQRPEGKLRDRLTGLDAPGRTLALLELVRTHAAAALGHGSIDPVLPDRAFRDLGFSSLTAVELRNRLGAVTGLRLPTTLVFDYPTSSVLAGYLHEQMFGSDGSTAVSRAPVAHRVMEVDEPVAIVGMACRFPGGVGSPEEFWDLLVSGRDAVSGFPVDRGWDAERFFDPDVDSGRAGVSYACEGGFLHDAAEFDAAFFGISPREALAMDPQQRLMLEASWEALERAGIEPGTLRGSQTGVFTGMSQQDYADLIRHGTQDLEGYAMTGISGSVLSGRLSYLYGLEGPAVTVDTACSSSLVALHLACQSLRAGECSMALAGGVTVMSTPGVFVEFSRQRGLAPDGRCKAFAAAADGVSWGEGVGVLLVERLSDARRLGHQVLAVVRGSAVNQDGASNGLTAPNGPSQQRVISQALANAGLSAADVDAVEGHGTGTTLGDPIEAQALLATYGQERPGDQPLWLGSVKSNIGHTQAAAGVAGVIKMVLALRNGTLPRTLHVDEPSPHIDWDAGAVRLLTEEMPWPGEDGRPRRAGVSSFGVSGTNAHVIVEQAPVADVVPSGVEVLPVVGVVPWVVSARSERALRGQARRLRRFAAGKSDLDRAAVAHALSNRSVFEHRAVVLGVDREDFLRGLDALASGTPTPGLVDGSSAPAAPGKVVMLFGGQGTQWDGMAAELLDSSPVFAEHMADCARALEPYVDWSLLGVLRGEPDAPPLDRVDVVQPVLFAVMVSLAALWRSYGVHPDAVAGHSQGEIAAAYVAGALSLDDAARIIALRSRALKSLAGQGAMLSVGMRAGELEPRLAEWGDQLSIAAVNGAGSAVVSGAPGAVDALAGQLTREGVPARKLRVDWASHSPQVEAVREDLLDLLAPVRPRAGEVPLYSAVTGRSMDGSELGAEYWYRNLRQVVRFQEATEALAHDGHRLFVEVGPHPAVSVAVQETLDELEVADAVVVGSLRRGEGGMDRFLTSVARLFVSGGVVDWSGATGLGTAGDGAVDLPTYAFERERFWLAAGPDVVYATPETQASTGTGTEELWEAVGRADAVGVAELLGVGVGASLESVVPALGVWWRRCRERGVVDGWRYGEVWKPVGGGDGGVLSGCWLVVVPGVTSGVGGALGGAGGAVVEGLERAGARVVGVQVEVGEGCVDREVLAGLLGEAVGAGGDDGVSG